MKENDIVCLSTMNQELKDSNLYKGICGIVIEVMSSDTSKVLFLNDKIIGDYAVLDISNNYLEKEKVQFPNYFLSEIKKIKSSRISYDKHSLNQLKFNEGDLVELIVDDKKYTTHGMHKGDVGVVAIDYAIHNTILVDFSGVDKKGNYYGDCIEVNLDHIKIIK